jgi:hypothetical protein
MVNFDKDLKSLPITKLTFQCKTANKSAPNNPSRADCGTGVESFQKKYGNSIIQLCNKYTYALSGFYKAQTKEFWSVNSEKKTVDDFGLWEKPDDPDCSKLATTARLSYEAKSRKPNSAPAPLKSDQGVLRIKGMTLGDGASACSNIETISFTNDRLNLNICTITEGENVTRVFFDQTKSFVVKIERTVYVSDAQKFLQDALEFYGNALTRKDSEYTFGDVKETRGLSLTYTSCYGCGPPEFSFLMIDVGAFQEALDEGHRAYRKKEF